MEKFDARKLSTDAQQEIRYQVIRLKKKGHRRSEISDITGVHPGTISAWCKWYKNGGKKNIKDQKKGTSDWKQTHFDIGSRKRNSKSNIR